MKAVIWRRHLAVALIAALCLALVPSMKAKAEEVVQMPVALVNPSFEEDLQGWSYWRSGHQTGMSASSEMAAEGQASLKLDVRQNETVGVESTPFPVDAGAAYTVTASVYVEHINAESSSAGINLWIRFYEDNTLLSGDARLKVSATDVETGAWQQLTVKGVAPAEANRAIVFPYVDRYTDIVAYYDDVRITQLIPATVPYNAGFELIDPSGTGVPGWSSSPSEIPEGNSMSVSEEQAYNGSRSLKLVDTRTDKSLGARSSDIQVIPGNAYTFDVYTHVQSGGVGRPFYYLYFYNASGSQLSSTSYGAVLETDRWHKVTAFNDIVAPDGATHARLMLNLGVGTLLTVYFDDVTVTEKQIGLRNAGFEEVAVGAIPGWTLYPNPLRDGTAIELSSDQAASGIRSVRFDDRNSGASMALLSNKIDIKAGSAYAASVMTYIVDGSSRIYIKYYDAGGQEVGSMSQGASGPVGVWTKVQTKAIAPEQATQAQIWLYSGGGTVGTVYYDDVTFEEVAVLELPYEFGAPVSLGDATVVAKTQGGAIGNGEIYFGASGSPAAFYAVDALSGKVNFTQELPNHDVVWAVTIGSDDNVYVAGTQTGILFRYLPTEKKLENLGVNPSNRWVWDLDASADGKIYGSTYPDSKAFVYDIASDTFTDLGSIKPGQDYVRGGGVTEQYFYAGIGTTAHLYRIDRVTGEQTEVPLPITGQSTSVSNIWAYGGKLFIAYGTSLLVIDETTYEVLEQLNWQDPNTFDGLISPPSPYDSNLIYFRNKNTSQLWTYHLGTNEIALADPDVVLPNKSLKAINWMPLPDGPNAGRHVLVMMTNEIDQMIYDPIDRTLKAVEPEVQKSGIDIQSLETGPDGNLYMGGYQGAMSVYDTALGKFTLQEKEPHQIEGIGFLNGQVYFGIYGGAVISRFDPELPFEPGTNPVTAYDIGDEQSRPFTFTSGENKLFVGTISDYGQLGGALTVYDADADTWTVHRNVVQDQSVIGLAYHEGRVFGGTSIWGGLGIDPAATEAKLFEWDVASGQKLAEFVPAVPGFVSPQMIGELSMGPDGLLWGIMWGRSDASNSAFALFALEPKTKSVVKSKVIPTGEKASSWRPFFMRWGSDGLLYTTLGRQLHVFDPETLASRQLVSPYVHLMTLGPDGSVYYAQGAKLMKLPVRMESASLSVDRASLMVGEEAELEVSLQLVNGLTGNADGTAVTYAVSDPSVIKVVEGKVVAVGPGTATISATVTQDEVQRTTESVEITVEADVTAPDAPVVLQPTRPWSTHATVVDVMIAAESGATVYIVEGETVIAQGTVAAGEDQVTILLEGLAQGIHKLDAYAVDRAGNASAAVDMPHIIINNGKSNK